MYDRANAMEVAFRMCSRRGATWDPDKSVLDEKDIRLFVEQRWEKEVAIESMKTACLLEGGSTLSILSFLDSCKTTRQEDTKVQHTEADSRKAHKGRKPQHAAGTLLWIGSMRYIVHLGSWRIWTTIVPVG